MFIKIKSLHLNLEIYSKVLSSKNNDYYITCMSFYVDVAVEVTNVLQLYTIKEISDLLNAILADGVDFGYKSNAI